MKEAYCSYEISKLLKEKGFDIHCNRGWDTSVHDVKQSRMFSISFDKKDKWISSPTHQMAYAWLREKNIGIIPEIHTTQNPKDYFWSAIIYYLDKSWDILQYVSAPSKNISEGYDDVMEQAIKYSLKNLI